jgi:hypothetical protein
MKILVIAVVASGFAAGAGAESLAARPDGLKAAFHNTIVSTYPDGRQARLWLNEDGSYTAEGRRHDPSRGHWTLKGDTLCLSQSHPFVFGMGYCTQIRRGGVGTSWTSKAVTGEPIRITVVSGRA